jgi:ABC-type transport system involved in multi-copper enzyme maturation permease subunit
MTDRIAMILGGPVLRREYLRSLRGTAANVLLFAYLVWLACYSWHMVESFSDDQQALSAAASAPTSLRGTLSESRSNRLAQVRRLSKFSREYISFLLHQQLVLIVIVVPLVTAGAIVYEKEKDTLQALFGTELTSREIVTGKVIGRLIGISRGLLAILPPLVFVAVLAGIPIQRILLATVQAVVLSYALASCCMLLSLWTRRSTDAVLGAYSALVVAFVGGQLAPTSVRIPLTLNPLSILDDLLIATHEVALVQYMAHILTWSAIGTVLCWLAVRRLRPVSIASMDARPPRWSWASRPPIGENPIRWREYHVFGIAPLPVLRQIPRWVGFLCVFTASTILAVDATAHALGTTFRYAVSNLDFEAAYGLLRRPDAARLVDDIHIMGGLLLVIGSLTVVIRCAGSISEEKSRKSWEALLLTPLELREILAEKYRGILEAGIAPMVIYCVPMFAVSAFSGMEVVVVAAFWAGAAIVVVPVAGGLGMGTANRGESDSTAGPPRTDQHPLVATLPGGWD